MSTDAIAANGLDTCRDCGLRVGDEGFVPEWHDFDDEVDENDTSVAIIGFCGSTRP